jgi:FixJ family two-component response regulator
MVTKTKPVIAIVDDNESFREALAEMLSSCGFESLEFPGAQEFLDFPRRERVSCVISDIQMPGMSGLELHEKISASERPIPIILITAVPSDEARKRSLNAGAVCYIAKPFVEEELLTCIQIALSEGTS